MTTNTMIAVAWVMSIVAVLLVLLVTFVISFVCTVRRDYHGPQTFSTWRLVKMSLKELIGGSHDF